MLNSTLIAQRVSTTFRSYLNNCFYLLMYIFEELLLIRISRLEQTMVSRIELREHPLLHQINILYDFFYCCICSIFISASTCGTVAVDTLKLVVGKKISFLVKAINETQTTLL